MMRKIILLTSILLTALCMSAQPSAYAYMEGDTLYVGNALIERVLVCGKDGLRTLTLTDRTCGKVLENHTASPDLVLLKGAGDVRGMAFSCTEVGASEIHPEYLKAVVSYSVGGLDIRREYRIYDGVPAIGCDTYLRGHFGLELSSDEGNAADRKNIESVSDMKSRSVTAVLDRLEPGGNHWNTKAVEFRDVTDWNNNLVEESSFIPYRKTGCRGNILFARDGVDGNGFFFLKEAPCSSVQLAYKGADFITEFGKFMVTGIGLEPADVSADSWVRAYSCVIGVFGQGELSALTSLRLYQKAVRRYVPERDEMIMMNTWGDRSQDAKVNEAFCLEEIGKAASLGVTHFQIDDGWQSGKSPNSALAKGSFRNIWDNPSYWTPDPEKYPRGLSPVVEAAAGLGLEVGLWYNPSVQDDFADWKKDADAIVGLYEEYGIRIFKIDGLTIAGKRAETNLRRLFDDVMDRTGNAVMFNLDATASRRGGYHMLNEYGNIFLENRYTDWGNYYPYHTLRNLWMLSRYVPSERIQVEFLNKWRNQDKYGADVFAPGTYSFDYLFAITMAGQPLAWMEASNLPEEAFSLRTVIDAYRRVSADFHEGIILPIGEEPSGRSWTGFQSVGSAEEGYILVFRELSDEDHGYVKTWLPEGAKVRFSPVLGYGRAFFTRVERDGEVEFSLPEANTYALYRYRIVR